MRNDLTTATKAPLSSLLATIVCSRCAAETIIATATAMQKGPGQKVNHLFELVSKIS